jgi:hypothetical protein
MLTTSHDHNKEEPTSILYQHTILLPSKTFEWSIGNWMHNDYLVSVLTSVAILFNLWLSCIIWQPSTKKQRATSYPHSSPKLSLTKLSSFINSQSRAAKTPTQRRRGMNSFSFPWQTSITWPWRSRNYSKRSDQENVFSSCCPWSFL